MPPLLKHHAHFPQASYILSSSITHSLLKHHALYPEVSCTLSSSIITPLLKHHAHSPHVIRKMRVTLRRSTLSRQSSTTGSRRAKRSSVCHGLGMTTAMTPGRQLRTYILISLLSMMNNAKSANTKKYGWTLSESTRCSASCFTLHPALSIKYLNASAIK